MSFPDPMLAPSPYCCQRVQTNHICSEDQEHDAPREFRVNSFRSITHPYDAKALLSRPPWVFTSPNLSEIPFVEVSPTPLYARADGRFGLEDYVVWPQSYSEAYPWAPCVLRKPAPDVLEAHPHWFLWEDLTASDWVAPPGASWQKTGVLRDCFLRIFRREMQPIMSRALEAGRDVALPAYVVVAVHALTATLARLQDLPMSYRDLILQFTQAQRLALDLLAMEAYHGYIFARMTQRQKVYPLRAEFIGCHTVNPTTVENMFHAGIPVVYIRPSQVTTPSQVRVSCVVHNFAKTPEGIVTAQWPDHPCKVLHDGASGTRRFQMSRPCGRYFEDLIPLPDIAATPVCMDPFLSEDPYQGNSGMPAITSHDADQFDDSAEQAQSTCGAARSPSPSDVTTPHHINNPRRTSKDKVIGGGVVKQTMQPNSRQGKRRQYSKSIYVQVSFTPY